MEGNMNKKLTGQTNAMGLYWVYNWGCWTGYSMTEEEWDNLIYTYSLRSLKRLRKRLKQRKVTA